MKQIFDELIPSSNTKDAFTHGIGIILFFIASSSIGLYVRWKILKFVKSTIKQLQIQLVDKFLSLPREQYTKFPPEKLHLIMTTETARQDSMINALFGTFLPSLIISFLLIICLFYINTYLSLFIFIGLAFVFLFHRLLSKKSKIRSKAFHNAYNLFSQGILFISHKTDLIHTQSTEIEELKNQSHKIEGVHTSSIQMIKTNTLFTYIQENIMIVLTVLLLLLGASLVLSNSMTIGELLSYYLIIGLLKTHLRTFAISIPDIIEGKESYKTINEFLSISSSAFRGNTKIDLNNNIILKDIYFSYSEKQILKGISLEIKKGETTVLSGKNGSGKSTVLALIEGLYQPNKGLININNTNLNEANIAHYRKQIGIVQQQPTLFSGSILDNIIYGNSNIEISKVNQALVNVGIDSFINSLPDKLDANIGDNGILLSGGQQQRIAIARAILNQPSLLILDEPTNHLDSESVALLIQQLKSLPFHPTILIVSHHQSIFSIADSVYELDNGKTLKVK